MISHKIPVDISNSSVHSSLTLVEQQNAVRQLRSDLLYRTRSIIQQSPSPIRVMARMVAELEKQCRELNIAEEVLRSEIVNRTIGEVDLRWITECEGESGYLSTSYKQSHHICLYSRRAHQTF